MYVIVCWDAALYKPSPAWLATILHDPPLKKRIVVPLTRLHAPLAVMEIPRPDVADTGTARFPSPKVAVANALNEID